ncbi:hypothetical protein DTO166G4_4192 [Paecilomyces variotii]|nr:hypothetical protein DTO166G4_4192 [Paecilomyces variotii]KAJ9228039.1 hypothetical protein DTO166G5_8892 [Paecilomyces variotii]KAJ9369375.1 hypothetical protein DTO282E5_5898 [Paecilomyces variotii]
MASMQEVDALVVGAGFGGLWMTNRLKEAALNVLCVEKAPQAGGVWYWNCYPGARVDSRYPVYQYSDESLCKDWNWSELFPGYEEIRKYLSYAVDKWQLNSHIRYNTTVTGARFDESDHKWTVEGINGSHGTIRIRCRWYILALGFASKPYIPDFEGLNRFQGPCFHSSAWPQEGIDLKDRRVAVVGTGASAVQIIQTISKEVGHLTVYQRTPCTAMPMRQQSLTPEYQDNFKASGEMAATMRRTKYERFGGQDVQFVSRRWHEDTPEQRRAVFEQAWQKGGFHLLLSTYFEVFDDVEVNHAAWRFWAEKSRERIHNTKYKDILAPLEAVHAFGGKRTPFEQDYFEAFNRRNVDLIDMKASPILSFAEKGIITQNEGLQEFDVIILATGFDTNTGALTSIHIQDTDGILLKDRWSYDGVRTTFGMSTSKFPNMFFFYGPQAPTAFSNGPSCIELQGEFVEELILDMIGKGVTRVDTTSEAEKRWKESTLSLWNQFVFSSTKGFYTGENIPGKKAEPLNWFGGFPRYRKALTECRDGGYKEYSLQSLPKVPDPEHRGLIDKVAVVTSAQPVGA